MDANLAIAVVVCGTAVVTCAISTGLILWKGGAQAERVESSVRRIEGIEQKLGSLSEIPALARGQAQLENVVSRMQSDFAQLRTRVDETRDRAIRAELASQSDIGE